MRKERGFTLIELLVVIAIIGYLSVIGIVSLNGARENARDARRKSDLAQLRLALTLYHDANGAYPATVAGGGAADLSYVAAGGSIWDADAATNPIVTEYLAGRFVDPVNSSTVYYSYDTDNGVNSKYRLCAVLESPTYAGKFVVSDETGDTSIQSSCSAL